MSDTGVVQIFRNGSEVASITLSMADREFFNPRGGKVGLSTIAAASALLDDFGGGTTIP